MKTNRAYRESPSQTAGPYVHIGLTPNFSGVGSVYPYDLGSLPVDQAARGERIAIEGLVLDGAEAYRRWEFMTPLDPVQATRREEAAAQQP